MFGVLFGITAGIMTEVAIKSLLLEAARYDPEDRVVSKVCSSSGSRFYQSATIKKCEKRFLYFSHLFHGSVLAKSQPLPLVDS